MDIINKRCSKIRGNKFAKALAIITFISQMLIISSCSKPGECLAPYKTDDKININLELFAKNPEWTDSGFSVSKGEEFTVEITGKVNIAFINSSVILSSKVQEITNANIGVNLGDRISIRLTNPNNDYFSRFNLNGNARQCTTDLDDTCIVKNGRGIQIYIDDTLIEDYTTKEFPTIKSFTDDMQLSPEYENIISNIDELGAKLSNRLVMITAPKKGQLGFKVSDVPGAYSDNSGEYNLAISTNSVRPGNYYDIENSEFGMVEYVISSEKPIDTDKTITLQSSEFKKITSSSGGKIWFRVKDSASYYSDNRGKYNINITAEKVNEGVIGKFLNAAIQPVKDKTADAAKIIYLKLISDPSFRAMVNSMLVLYIILYAIYFMFGMAEISQKELFLRIIKIAIVSTLLSPTSWSIFNDYFLKLFTKGSEELLMYVTGTNANNEAGIFAFVDKVFVEFFSTEVWTRMLSIMFSLPGIVIVLLWLFAMYSYVFIIIEVFIAYLMVILSLSVLISIAPLFIILILFQTTKQYFDGWVKYLVNFTLQPIILFTMLGIMNDLLITAFHNMLDFPLCWQCIFDFEINLSSFIPFIQDSDSPLTLYLFCFEFYKFTGPNMIMVFCNVIVFLIFVTGLSAIMDFAPQMADFLTSNIAGSATQFTGSEGQGSVANRMATSAKAKFDTAARKVVSTDAMKSLAGIDKESKDRREGVKNSNEAEKKLKSMMDDKDKNSENSTPEDNKDESDKRQQDGGTDA